MSGLPAFSDPYLEISRGSVDGYSMVSLRGHDAALSATLRIMAPFATKFAVPAIADAVQVSSNSAADDAPAGTGARTVLVEGLDEDFLPISETFSLNGTTAVVGTALFLRINRVTVLTAGSGVVNAGAIFVSPSGQSLTGGEPDSDIYATVEAGESVSTMAIYTVPAGKSAYLVRGDAQNYDATDVVNVRIVTFEVGSTVRKIDNRTLVPASGTVPLMLSGLIVPEKTDVRVEAFAAAAIEATAILTLVVL